MNIYNFYVYHQITIWQICINWKNGNSVVHMKIVIFYLFLKLTELQFGGPQICWIASQTETQREPGIPSVQGHSEQLPIIQGRKALADLKGR